METLRPFLRFSADSTSELPASHVRRPSTRRKNRRSNRVRKNRCPREIANLQRERKIAITSLKPPRCNLVQCADYKGRSKNCRPLNVQLYKKVNSSQLLILSHFRRLQRARTISHSFASIERNERRTLSIPGTLIARVRSSSFLLESAASFSSANSSPSSASPWNSRS